MRCRTNASRRKDLNDRWRPGLGASALLSGWYAAYYDPRVVAPAIAELVWLVEHIVRESGRGEGFDAGAWVEDWIHIPHPALAGRCPVELLSTAEGVQLVRETLSRQQSSAYS